MDENGSRVHLWATRRPEKDSDRTYIFAFIDDGKPEELKPIYLSKTQDADATDMPHYEWAIISYAYNADDWYKIMEIPDMILGVVGPAPSFGNGLSENASGMLAMHDLWSDEYNNMMIPVAKKPDSFLGASQSIYSNNVGETMLGDRETIEYCRNSSPFLDYFTVDKATGVTLAFRYTFTGERGSFTSQKAIISASDFNVLSEDEKRLNFDVSTIEETLKNFSKYYYHAFSLAVPESTNAFRVVCSDDNTTVSGNYTSVLVNPSRVYPVSVPKAYDGTITLKWKPGNDYIFDRWEVNDFTTHTWKTIPLTQLTDPEAPPTAKLNTPDNPLTDIAYIRCIKHKAPPVMCQVKVNSGTFTISGDTEHYSDAPVPYGTIISLSNINIDNKTFDHWVDKDGHRVERYWELEITGDEEFTPIYADSIFTINVSAYNEHGSVWQVGNDKSKGTSCICRGTAGTAVQLSTSGDPDNGFTEFLGWYHLQRLKSGNIIELLSKNKNYTYMITGNLEGEITAVWGDGTFVMEPQPVLVKVTGGFVSINIAWGDNPRMLYVSSADFYGDRESIMVIDDTKDALHVGSWRVDWVSPEGDRSETYNQVHSLHMSLESADDYSEHLVTITGVQVPPCATHTWDKGTVTTAATHMTAGVMTYTCTVCGAGKTGPIAKTTDHEFGDWIRTGNDTMQRTCPCEKTDTKQIENRAETLPATSDGITVNIGTDTSIPAGTVVNTENLTEKLTENEKKTLQSAIKLVLTNENGEELVSLFNISLEFEGSKLQPDGTVKVELPIPENAAKAYKSFKVVYIDDAGVAHEMPTEMKDGKVIFTTDHFSQYAIVGIERTEERTGSTAGIERVKAADSGNSMQIWVWMLVGTLAAVAFVAVSVCIMRRKRRAN